MNINETKKKLKENFKFLENKKIQWAITGFLLLAILFLGVYIRTSGLPNLIDSTTGDYTPLALDPYYFLRISETIVTNDGILPETDVMRNAGIVDVAWHHEILPQSTILIWNIVKIFNSDATLNFANVLNPVIFFALGIIVFFFLCYFLTNNKWIALLSSGLLTIIPPYLYRTLAGFSDHESIGMFAFFSVLLLFTIGCKYLEKKNAKMLYSGILGLITGLSITFAALAWTGTIQFIFMILPISFLLIWLVKDKKYNPLNYILFYFFLIFGFMLTPLFSIITLKGTIGYMTNVTGIFTFFTLGFIIFDYLLSENIKKIPESIKQYKIILAGLITVFVGMIGYQLFLGNVWELILNLINKVIHPFGTARVAVTVAENQQPYLNDWIEQIGQKIFYIMLIGIAFISYNISKGIKQKKFKLLFNFTFLFFIAGLLFSRISSASIFNGENFISSFFLAISALSLAINIVYISFKSKWEIPQNWIIIVMWTLPVMLAIRSAVRSFFLIVPLASLLVILSIFEFYKIFKNSKDELVKIFSLIGILIIAIVLIFGSIGYYKTVSYQAKYQSPSYTKDWQNAMSWVRENTTEGSVFLHWWDYGYWVQTGGERPTVADGGHSQEFFNGNHKIGRYVLTTPYPETAKSFMKSLNVSYLLIDPTDIGKYSAYSSIGNDEEVSDRLSYLPTLINNPQYTQETSNSTIKIFEGGAYLDEDITYENTFLAKENSGVIGVILTQEGNMLKQPTGVYVSNGKRIDLPVRKIFINGELIDFGSGVDATIYLYNNVIMKNNIPTFDTNGAAMYLSSRTQDSLVAKLYLMNDPNNEYSELELAHSQGNPIMYYNGFIGPIKIWKTNIEEMTNIIPHEEFYSEVGEYGGMDDFQFIMN